MTQIRLVYSKGWLLTKQMRQSGCESEVCKDGEAETGKDVEGGSGVDEECGVDQRWQGSYSCNNSCRPMRGQHQSLVDFFII